LFLDFLLRHPGIGILFVNDGSTDGTAGLLDSLVAKMPLQAGCLHLKRNAGKAEAVRQGFLEALKGSAEFIGYFDADLATPLESAVEFEGLLASVPRWEIVLGSRVKLMGRKIERDARRHYLGRFFATFASMTLGIPVYDTQCGAKLFRVTDRLKDIFSRPFLTTWIFDVEILARFIKMGRGRPGSGDLNDICVECPLHEWVDKKGSKLKLGHFLASAWDLLRVHSYLLARD
jgi:glycosyltransferase involved in cell wall biosynthesis